CPCGSGETLVAMAHLVPFSRLVAVVSDQIAALRFDFSPLKHLITSNVKLARWEDIQEGAARRRGWLCDTGFRDRAGL
ncbi:MAG: hypothetical protein P9M14_03420, partial [Candidatus Alcyoniella australis]|nr:hypothetical protein [Candidatus Alcyoniella australis]